MATNGQLFERFLNGETLLPSERQQLTRAVDSWDEARQILDGVMNGRQGLEHPMIFDPNWRTSPLHSFTIAKDTTTAIVTGTDTFVTFDLSYGDRSIFDLWEGDLSKIRVDRSQLFIRVDGSMNWAANGTGLRALDIRFYDASDVFLAGQTLHRLGGTAVLPTVPPFSFTFDIRKNFQNAAYARFVVYQDTGANLDLRFGVATFALS